MLFAGLGSRPEIAVSISWRRIIDAHGVGVANPISRLKSYVSVYGTQHVSYLKIYIHGWICGANRFDSVLMIRGYCRADWDNQISGHERFRIFRTHCYL